MKLEEFKKIVDDVYEKCGDVDIEFLNSKGNLLELESVGHFNFVKDVTMTFKKYKPK